MKEYGKQGHTPRPYDGIQAATHPLSVVVIRAGHPEVDAALVRSAESAPTAVLNALMDTCRSGRDATPPLIDEGPAPSPMGRTFSNAALTPSRDTPLGDVLHAAHIDAISTSAGQEITLLVWRECAHLSWN